MMVAMVVEAGLCLPQAGAGTRGRRTRHERLAIAHVPLDALVGRRCRSCVVLRRGRLLLRRLAAERLPPVDGAARSCLRLALVGIAAVLLNQPEWVEEYRPEEKPAIAVLWDASPSMETRDVVDRRRADGSRPMTRREAIAPLTEIGALGNRCASG